MRPTCRTTQTHRSDWVACTHSRARLLKARRNATLPKVHISCDVAIVILDRNEISEPMGALSCGGTYDLVCGRVYRCIWNVIDEAQNVPHSLSANGCTHCEAEVD